MAQPNNNLSDIRHRFQSFFNGWVVRQEHFLRRLLEAIEPRNKGNTELHRALIDELFSHYLEYFQEKNRAAEDDVFLVLSPPWLNAAETLFLWMGGFKPLFVFKLIESSVGDLSSDQKQSLDSAKRETRNSERELSRTMARLQETVASPQMLDILRRFSQIIDGEVSDIDSATGELKRGIASTVEAADRLRGTAVCKAAEILVPHQMVKLLAAFTQLHIHLRRWRATE